MKKQSKTHLRSTVVQERKRGVFRRAARNSNAARRRFEVARHCVTIHINVRRQAQRDLTENSMLCNRRSVGATPSRNRGNDALLRIERRDVVSARCGELLWEGRAAHVDGVRSFREPQHLVLHLPNGVVAIVKDRCREDRVGACAQIYI